jgi:hypothetical protein
MSPYCRLSSYSSTRRSMTYLAPPLSEHLYLNQLTSSRDKFSNVKFAKSRVSYFVSLYSL